MSLTKGAIMYMGWWQKQVCLRDALIDDLVAQVELERMIANAEIRMSEVMRKELAKALAENEELSKDIDELYKHQREWAR